MTHQSSDPESPSLTKSAVNRALTDAATDATTDTGASVGELETPAGGAVPQSNTTAAPVAGLTSGDEQEPKNTKSVANSSSNNSGSSSGSIARNAGLVSIAVMGSRLLGLVREQVMAKYFGAGFLSDAFVVAFRIPNLLRDLFAEGALSAAFVKTFTDYSLKEDKDAAWRLAAMVMNLLVVVLSAVSIIGVVFAPHIVGLMTSDGGFSPEKAALAVTMTRVMFPFLILVALAAVAMGVLNTRGQFGIPASASTMFNVGSIVGGLGFAYYLSGGGWSAPRDATAIPDLAAQRAIIGMSIGTLIGGALQFLIQVPSLYKVGFRFRPLLSVTDAGVRQVMRLMAPAIIGTSAVQVNVLINTWFASDIPGGQSWLNYSFRLMQFPIGVFGVAISSATLPAISRLAAQNDVKEFRQTLASSLNLVFLLTIPSACGLAVLGRPIISLIYERGAFSAQTTEMVALALAAYSIGLAGYSAIKVLSPAFYALNDARTPMFISIISIIVNIFASYLFKNLLTPYGIAHVGLALSTSCVALVNFFALLYFMRRKIGSLDARRILSSLIRIIAASLALCLTSYASYYLLQSGLGEHGLARRLIVTLVPVAIGGTTFFIVARLLRVAELKQATEAFTRKFGRRRLLRA